VFGQFPGVRGVSKKRVSCPGASEGVTFTEQGAHACTEVFMDKEKSEGGGERTNGLGGKVSTYRERGRSTEDQVEQLEVDCKGIWGERTCAVSGVGLGGGGKSGSNQQGGSGR